MKNFIIFLISIGISIGQEAATGDYVFRKKVARGYESVNITPDNSKVLGWSNGNLANVTGGGGGSTIVGITGTKAEFDTAATDNNFGWLSGGNTWSGSQTFGGFLSVIGGQEFDGGSEFLGSVIFDGDINFSGTSYIYGDGGAAHRSALGLVIGTNVQAYDADLTTWAGVTPGAGVATALAVATNATGGFSPINGTATLTNKTLALGSNTISGTKAQFDTAVTDDNVGWLNSANTWTGLSNIFNNGISTSSLTTAGIVTFDAGSTFSYDTGIAALHRTALGLGALSTVTPGTGIATALAINTGSAGAPVLYNGAGGTPSSITLTNATGTAASLTAGNATLAAGLSANLATSKGGLGADNSAATGIPVFASGTATVTAATGTGSPMRGTSPTVTTSLLFAGGGSITEASGVVTLASSSTGTLGTSIRGYNGIDFYNTQYGYSMANLNAGAFTCGTITTGNATKGCRFDGNYGMQIGSTGTIGWVSSTNLAVAPDTALYRNAAGVVEINNGTAGTYRDLKLRTLTPDSTVTAGGTTGAQTINKSAGTVNFAAAATSLVVTNSLVTTSSIILCTIATNDATAANVKAVAGSGSFTIYLTAPTAETRVNFLLTN